MFYFSDAVCRDNCAKYRPITICDQYGDEYRNICFFLKAKKCEGKSDLLFIVVINIVIVIKQFLDITESNPMCQNVGRARKDIRRGVSRVQYLFS